MRCETLRGRQEARTRAGERARELSPARRWSVAPRAQEPLQLIGRRCQCFLSRGVRPGVGEGRSSLFQPSLRLRTQTHVLLYDFFADHRSQNSSRNRRVGDLDMGGDHPTELRRWLHWHHRSRVGARFSADRRARAELGRDAAGRMHERFRPRTGCVSRSSELLSPSVGSFPFLNHVTVRAWCLALKTFAKSCKARAFCLVIMHRFHQMLWKRPGGDGIEPAPSVESCVP